MWKYIILLVALVVALVFYFFLQKQDRVPEEIPEIRFGGFETISVRSETSGTVTCDINDAGTVNAPATIENGDYIVVVIGSNDVAPNLSVTDFTTTQGEGASGNDAQAAIAYKLVTDAGSEPSTYPIVCGFVTGVVYWIASIDGIDQTTPQDENFASNWAYRTDDTSPAAGSITTITDGAFVLAAWAVVTDTDVTMPGGSWATEAEDVNVAATIGLSVASQTFAADGATGNVDVTDVGAGQETEAGQFAFRPAATAGGSIDDTYFEML